MISCIPSPAATYACIVWILLGLNKCTYLCAGVTGGRFHEILFRGFFSVKTRGFSLHILALFLAIDNNIVCELFLLYLSEQIDKYCTVFLPLVISSLQKSSYKVFGNVTQIYVSHQEV